MNVSLSPEDLARIAGAVADELARRGAIAGKLDAERLAYPEPEAARQLGLASHVLRDARRRGEIDGRRVGRSVVYSARALLAWLEGDDQ